MHSLDSSTSKCPSCVRLWLIDVSSQVFSISTRVIRAEWGSGGERACWYGYIDYSSCVGRSTRARGQCAGFERRRQRCVGQVE